MIISAFQGRTARTKLRACLLSASCLAVVVPVHVFAQASSHSATSALRTNRLSVAMPIQITSGEQSTDDNTKTYTPTTAAPIVVDSAIVDNSDGAVSVVQDGSGTTTFSANNTYTGTTSVKQGTLALSGTASIATSSGVDVAAGATLDGSALTSGTMSVQSLTGANGAAVILGANTLDLTNAGGTFAGIISGSGGVDVSGGTATFSGGNSYLGTTTVDEGATLTLSGSVAGGLVNNGTANIGGTVAGATTNTGDLSALNATLHNITNTSGTVVLNNTSAGAVTSAADATFKATFGSFGDVQNSGTLTLISANAGNVTNTAEGNFTATGSGTLSSVNNAGTATLGESNVVNGDVTNTAGSLTLDKNTITRNLIATGGSFTVTSNGSEAGSLSGAGAGNLEGMLTLTNATETDHSTYSGVMSGTGGVTITSDADSAVSSETFTGKNTYTGDTDINAGSQLLLSGDGNVVGRVALNSNGESDASKLDVSGANHDLVITSLAWGNGSADVELGSNNLVITNASDTYNGNISGTGDLTVSGGTETLGGTTSYTGATVVTGQGTTLNFAGVDAGTKSVTVEKGATISGSGTIGSASNNNVSVTVDNTSTIKAGLGGANNTFTILGNLDVEGISDFSGLGGNGSGKSSTGSIIVSGDLTLNGTISVTDLSSSYGPGVQNLYQYGGTLNGTILDNSIKLVMDGNTVTNAGQYLQSGNGQVNLILSDGATLNFWNGSTTVAGVHVNGGDGTWTQGDSTPTNWTDSTGATPASSQAKDFAVFEQKGGTVTVAGNVDVAGMQFTNTQGNKTGELYQLTPQDTQSSITLYGTAADKNSTAFDVSSDANNDAQTTGMLTNESNLVSVIRVGSGSNLSGTGLSTDDVAVISTNIKESADGATTLVKTDAGTLVLTGNNTYSGGTVIAGGVLEVTSDANLGKGGTNIAIDGGTLKIGADNMTTPNRQIIAGKHNATIDLDGHQYTPGAEIIGPGSVIIQSSENNNRLTYSNQSIIPADGIASKLTLNYNNTYTGNTTVHGIGGTLGSDNNGHSALTVEANNATPFGSSNSATDKGGSVYIDQAAVVNMNGASATQGASLGYHDVTVQGSEINFNGVSDAGNASVTNSTDKVLINYKLVKGVKVGGTYKRTQGSIINFNDESSAKNATISNESTSNINFNDNSTAGSSKITNGGNIAFTGTATADNATISNNITTEPDNSTHDDSRIDISGLSADGVSIGSLSGSGKIDLGSKNLTVGNLNQNDTISGIIEDGGNASGTGGRFTKIGNGTQTLTNANTYTGATTISAGTLALTGNGSIENSAVDINTTATFDVSGTSNGTSVKDIGGSGNISLGGKALTLTDASKDTVYSGVASGSGGSIIVQGGTESLSGANTYTGKTVVESGAGLNLTGSIAGVLNNDGTTSITGTTDTTGKVAGTTTNTGTLTTNGANLSDVVNNITGIATLTSTTMAAVTNAATATLNMSGGSATTVTNAGQANLSSAAKVAGATTNTGTLTTNGVNLSDVNNNAGTATLTSTTMGAVNNAENATLNIIGGSATTITNSGNTTLSSGNTVDSVTTSGGSLTLSGNTITNTLAANGGILDVESAGSTVGSLSGGANGTLEGTLTLTNAKDTYSGGMEGNGNVVIAGGTEILTGANTYSGTTTINNGAILQVDGAGSTGTGDTTANGTLSGTGTVGGNATIASGGTLSAGDGANGIGTLTVAGNLTLADGSTQKFQIGQANTAGGQYNDLVSVGGDLTLGGTLNVTTAAGGPDVQDTALKVGVYRLYNYGGALSGSQTLGNMPSSGTTDFSLQTSVAKQVNLVVDDGKLTFWDGDNHTSHTDGPNGGDGTWIASRTANDTRNWTDQSGSRNARWDDGGFAVFQGKAGTVTVSDKNFDGTPNNVTFSGMQFANSDGGTYVITGDDLYATTNNTRIVVGAASNDTDLKAQLDTVINDSAVTGGSTDLVKEGAGTLIVTKDQTYHGATNINGGTLQLGDGGSEVKLENTTGIHANGTDSTLALNFGSNVTFDKMIDGSGNLTQQGAGTTTLTTNTAFTGATTITAGTLQLGNGGETGDIANSSAIHNNSSLTINRSNAENLTQVIDGTGAVAQIGRGTTTLSGVNTYQGGTFIENGTLVGTTQSFGSGAINNMSALVLDQNTDGVFSNGLEGSGALTKTGTGTVVIEQDDSDFIGNTTVAAGTLAVDGSLAKSAIAVNNGGTLSGTGTVGATTVTEGGTLSPAGSAVGTLSVAGNLAMGQGSILAANGAEQATGNTVTVDGLSYQQMTSDLVKVSGAATLSGGTVAFNVEGAPALKYGQIYTLVSATQKVSGKYDALVTNLQNNYTYISPTLVYTDNDVNLALRRNDTSFSDGGDTRNERETGHGLDNLPENSPVVQAMEQLNGNDVRKGLNALSGEVHASARTALIQDSFFVRQAALDRLDSAECDSSLVDGSIHTAALKHGRDDGRCYSDRAVLWGEAYGSLGHNAGDGNAASMHHSTAGFIMGADTSLFETWRVGGLVSYGRSMFDVKSGRGSSGHSNNVTVGGYAGNHWGNLNLRLGATYTWDMLSIQRNVNFTGYSDRLSSGYLGGTAQAFAEMGYKFRTGHTTIEPFGNVAYVNLHTNGYTEHGGAAALHGRSTDTGVTFSTFGIKAASTFQVGKMQLTPRGSLSYRHAFGLTTATTHQMFAAASNGDMDIAGVALSTDAAVIDTGITAKITDSLDVGLSYIGQYGKQSVDSGARARVRVTF